jgi:hypothetical protein
MWGAGALDAVENVALLRMLDGGIDRLSARVSLVSATGKFALVGLGLVAALALAASAAFAAAIRIGTWRRL